MKLFLAHLLAGPTLGWLAWCLMPRAVTGRR